MIIQYYTINQKLIEFKDLIFTFCFMIISSCIYTLLGYKLNLNQLIILSSITFICIVQVGCNHRFKV